MLSVFLLALSLAIDAVAAAICCAVQSRRLRLWDGVKIGLWFGTFQTGMTLIGGLFGRRLSLWLWQAGAIAAFGLLAFLGGRMVWSALSPEGGGEERRYDLSPLSMAALALATSLDALAAGVSLAYLETDLRFASLVIGAVAFTLSLLGARFGARVGVRLSRWAELGGGAVLLFLGGRILLGAITE